MSAIQDLEAAKAAYDTALEEMTKYGNEMMDALQMHEKIQGRDTDGLFMQKAERAEIAYKNWSNSANLARKVIDEIYEKGLNYYR
jgi:hypothetical protein